MKLSKKVFPLIQIFKDEKLITEIDYNKDLKEFKNSKESKLDARDQLNGIFRGAKRGIR